MVMGMRVGRVVGRVGSGGSGVVVGAARGQIVFLEVGLEEECCFLGVWGDPYVYDWYFYTISVQSGQIEEIFIF